MARTAALFVSLVLLLAKQK